MLGIKYRSQNRNQWVENKLINEWRENRSLNCYLLETMLQLYYVLLFSLLFMKFSLILSYRLKWANYTFRRTANLSCFMQITKLIILTSNMFELVYLCVMFNFLCFTTWCSFPMVSNKHESLKCWSVSHMVMKVYLGRILRKQNCVLYLNLCDYIIIIYTD